jgi:chorismate synthase
VDYESEDFQTCAGSPTLRGRQLHDALARRRGGDRELHETQIQEQTKHQLVSGKKNQSKIDHFTQ